MAVSFPFLQVAFDKLASFELQGYLRREDIDLDEVVETLKRTLPVIQALHDEAEVKQFDNNLVKLWLLPVKQLLYDVENILDAFLIDFKSQIHLHQTQLSGTDSAEELQEIKRFGSKVRDINKKLKSVIQEGVALGLNLSMGSGSSKPRVFRERPPTSSLVDRSDCVLGRDDDKGKIIDWLLSDKTASPMVLPIVGMAGVGKTTLARLVYNDEFTVDKYFPLKAWVCVSEEFDVVRITKEILEAATGSSTDSSSSLNLLQEKLARELRKNRFLFVLDDIWNLDFEGWKILSVPFACGKSGSKILVTTRNKHISSIMRIAPNNHDLKCLSDVDCLNLVRRNAFMDGGNSSDADEKMELFGQEVVKKCKGLPLAIKTLAGLLRYKSENNEWKDILENEIWYLKENGILPSLMLSYLHLRPLLKRCFQYCALFPKDYVFNKIDLVMLWMAEGFVHDQPKPKRNKRVEDIGAEYFDELFMRSFFEISNRPPNYLATQYRKPIVNSRVEGEFGDLSNEFYMRSFFESSNNIGSGFVMHDLIHDLAELVSDGIYCRTEKPSAPQVVSTTTHHLSYLTREFIVEAAESKAMNKSLRTVLDLEDDNPYSLKQFLPIMQFQFLRVLRFRVCGNCELPDSIGKLKHLRLLDLLHSNFVRLPNAITSLQNLQTLVLAGCYYLREFPKDMGNLVNLRHLFLPRGNDSYKTLLGVSKLTSLQTLSIFYVGPKNSCELRGLSQFRGNLDISNLENVIYNHNEKKAMVDSLKNNTHLLGLRLRWSAYESNDSFPDLGRDEKVEEDVLDQLQPPTNLEALWIRNYGGTKFPSWMENPHALSNLEILSLFSCRKCRFLPHLRQLPLLKHLHIHNCNAIKMVENKLSGDGSSSANKQFRSLETLRIECMDEWEEWPAVVGEDEEEGREGQFPRLRQLRIKSCPKPRMFSHHFPTLVKLAIIDCSNLRELAHILPYLESLYVANCKEFCFLPMLPSLKELRLEKCKGMEFRNKTGSHFSSLSSLAISDLSDLKLLPNEFMQHMPTLEELDISDCRELTVLLQNESGSNLLPSSLRHLNIVNCNKLWKLPQSMYTLTSLQELKIINCSALVSFPERGLPIALQRLRILNCKNLKSLPMGLHKLTSLQILESRECPALESFPETGLPTALQRLRIGFCKNLKSLPMGLPKLTSLQILEIQECPDLKFFPYMGLPTTIQELSIIRCEKLKFLPKELHKITNLQKLEILKCSSLMNCNNQEPLLYWRFRNLTTLRSLSIGGCPTLVSIQKGMLPTNLTYFNIEDCPILESLHEGLLDITSLEELNIENCPMLQQRCQKNEKEEWSKISHIPRIEIDVKYKFKINYEM